MWPPEHSLITGASSGIGAALSKELAAPGITMTLTGRNIDRLEAVARICRSKGARIDIEVVDVCDRDDMSAAIRVAWRRQPIDLVIANAGISGGSGGDKRRIIETNIGGVLNTIEPVIELMRERGQGRLAIMSSLAGFKSFPNAPLYCASKSARSILW